jgi:hypothetical protein
MQGSLGAVRAGRLVGWLAAGCVVACGLEGSGLQATRAGDGGLPGGDASVDDASGGGFADIFLPAEAGYGEAGDGGDARGPTDGQADRAIDAGDAPSAADGPQGPSPGVINCAGTACAIGSSVCCTCANCFPPFPTSCFPSFPGCVTGVPVHCDDRTDCSAGQVCCGSLSTGTFTGSACKASCAAGDVQLCAVNAECAKGSCKASTAVPGFSTCM